MSLSQADMSTDRPQFSHWIRSSNNITQQFMAIGGQPDIVSLAGGLPAAELYPVEAIRQASSRALGRWGSAARLSARAEVLHKEEDEFTVQRAFALHQLDKGEEAAKVLLEAPEWLRRTGILHYNLGCYEARGGWREDAIAHVTRALELDPKLRDVAAGDEELDSIRAELGLETR